MFPSKTLFLATDEKVNLVFTGAFSVLVAGEIFMNWTGYLKLHFGLFALITGLISLQSLHVILTYIGLLFVPEFRRWIYLKSAGRVGLFWVKVVAAVIGLGIISFVVTDRYHHSPEVPKMVFESVGFFTIWFSIHHRLLQTYGITVANRHLQGTRDFDRFDRRLQKMERFALYPLLLLIGALLAIRSGYLKIMLNEFGIELSGENWNRLGKVSVSVAIAFALVVFIIGLLEWRRRPNKDHRLKIAHTVRFLFYPFTSVSYFALWAMESLHGVEYVSVWRKFFANSKNNRFCWTRGTLFALILIFVFYALIYVQLSMVLLLPRGQAHTHLERTLFAFSTSILYVHYYFDHVLFKMRDPVSRAITGTLLTAVPVRRDDSIWERSPEMF